MTRVNQLDKIVNCEGKLKGCLNSSLVVLLQQMTISNFKRGDKKEIRKAVKLKTIYLIKRKKETHKEKGFPISVATMGPHPIGHQTWFPI